MDHTARHNNILRAAMLAVWVVACAASAALSLYVITVVAGILAAVGCVAGLVCLYFGLMGLAKRRGTIT